jgi:hypothetical protein
MPKQSTERASDQIRHCQTGDIAERGVSPPSAVETKVGENQDLDRYPDAEPGKQLGPILRRHGEIESQKEGEHSGEHEDRKLNGSHYPPAVAGEVVHGVVET